MRFFLENWYLFLTAALSGGLLLWPVLRGGGGGGAAVSPAEAVTLINRQKAVLVDVSEPADYAAGHAMGARHVPLADFEKSPKGLPTNKKLPLLLMCPTGARATRAVGIAKKLGFEDVRSIAGGLRAWREAQLPVEKTAA